MADPDDARTLWDAALALNRAARPVSDGVLGRRLPLPPLLFFTDPARTPEPWRTAAALPVGAAVVYRHFGAPDAEATAQRLRQITADRGVLLLIGLDAELARQVEADGVHLPQRALDMAQPIRAAHPNWLITGAIHAPDVLLDAKAVDALVLSPIFAAGGASSVKPALGAGSLSEAVTIQHRPVYALGGITAANVAELTGSGVCGVAGLDAVAAAFGPAG